jgi:hypothetical protein
LDFVVVILAGKLPLSKSQESEPSTALKPQAQASSRRLTTTLTTSTTTIKTIMSNDAKKQGGRGGGGGKKESILELAKVCITTNPFAFFSSI